MSHIIQLADKLALDTLNAEFALSVNSGRLSELQALVEDDTIFSLNQRDFYGKFAFEKFAICVFGDMLGFRLFYNGLRLRFPRDSVAEGNVTWLLSKSQGDGNVRFKVFDVHDFYSLSPTGRWRFKKRIAIDVR